MRAPRSLQGRILALVLGLVAAVWAATLAVTWIDARHELDELLDSHLAQAAALLVVQQAGELDEERELDAPSLHRYAPRVAFQVFHEGRLVLRSADAPGRPLLDPAAFRRGFRTVRIGGVAWRVFAAHGRKRDVQVYVGEQVAARASILAAVMRGALWPMALALPILAAGAWWAVSWGVAPLRRLGRALQTRRPEALEPVEVAGAPAEMVPMLNALNALFARIRALLEAERRFTADAAHELRTPIAAIRAQAQVALAEAHAGRRRHALEATIEGCDRLARLVEQLLTLSRMEAAAAPAMAALDLAELVRRVVAEIAPRALAKDQALALDAPRACRVAGSETLLAVLVGNLVDNAVRYAPRGARVQVAVRCTAGRFEVRVEDSGAGMAEGDRARLGERFFRVAGSGESGSGLGWSIVRRIAAAHGFEVRAQPSEALGGLAATLAGPAGG